MYLKLITNSHLSTMIVLSFGLNCSSIVVEEQIKLTYYMYIQLQLPHVYVFLFNISGCIYINILIIGKTFGAANPHFLPESQSIEPPAWCRSSCRSWSLFTTLR